MSPPSHTRLRLGSIVGVLVGIIVLQVVIAVASIDILSSVRAYIAGESLYSKGQKDALLHLHAYEQYLRDSDFRLFLAALDVNEGDRIAREALQADEPDLERARQGLLRGRNHPQDIDGLIRLFLWFSRWSFMAEAIEFWTEGDAVITEMRVLVEQAHERIAQGDRQADAVKVMRERLPQFNARLTALEQAFSERLGEASRATRWMLLGLNLGVAGLLLAAGGSFVRRSLRLQAQNEADLRSREESLRLLLDSTAEGIFGIDTAGNCSFINRAALRMLGSWRESELLGRPILALIGGEDAAGLARAHDGAAATAPQQADIRVLQRRDGSRFPAECWSHAVVREGRIQGAVITFFDISERQRLQAELDKRELRISELVGAVSEGVVSVGVDGRIVLFNAAAERIFGLTQAQALGRPIEDLVPGAARTAGAASAAHTVPGAIVLHELEGLRADGTRVPLEASASTIDTDRGLLSTLVLRDMTDVHAARSERRAREALEAAGRARSALLSRISHELRTPLNAVLGFAQLLRMDPTTPLPRGQLERVHHIERAGVHLLGLVNDVLDLSCMEAGQLQLSIETVDLRVVVQESLALVSPMADAAAVELRTERLAPGPAHAADRWLVRADPQRLRQVIVNLLSNAVKYNRRGGTVALRCERLGDVWQLRIADTGIGMSIAQQRQLFQPFNRLGAERTDVDGTGIGLVLSLELVRAMRGTLEIDSAAGRGTAVHLALPMAQSPQREPSVPRTASPDDAPPRRLELLYAEDNEVNVELVREVIALRPGIVLRVAADGHQALQMARESPPDLMLLDMHLGDMDGIELARTLRRDSRTAGIPLVALSADVLDEHIDAALDAGIARYLTKPFDFRHLLEVLDSDPRAQDPAPPTLKGVPCHAQ